jgi:hypothetical protein
MIGRIWMDGEDDAFAQATRPQQGSGTADVSMRIRELEHRLGRITLLNQALWELLRERLNLSDADLERLVRDIDLRDGVEDGRITVTPLECPTCGRISSSKHWKCLYCGQLFEKPTMG